MKRDNNTNNLYFSPPSPNVTFNGNHNRPMQRESLPINQFLPPNQNEYQHRYSNNIDSNHSNNAFAHLRYEISNLRSQFTKLIQKDTINNDKAKEDKLNLSSNKREQRVTAQSTIGFYSNQSQGKADLKVENKADNNYFKNKLGMNDRKNSIENVQLQKSKKQQGNRYHKKYSFQIQQKRDENLSIQVIDSTKIQELQVEIRKLGELKHKSDEQNIHLKKELTKVQKQLQNKVNLLEAQNQKLKSQNQQIKISLSLKNSLVQKLQNENENYRKDVLDSQTEKLRIQSEIESWKNQIQTLGLNNKIELDKMHNRYEQKITSLQLIHQNNINDILQRLKQSQQNQRNTQLALLQKQDQLRELKGQFSKQETKIETQASVIQQLKKNINDLKIQNEQLTLVYKQLQTKSQQLFQQQIIIPPSQQIDRSKMKAIQDQNNDLKKRVQSFQKTVSQLNISNNSSRQKLQACKQESKKVKEQSKYLSQQLKVKQKLITSLYRDINILDAQIRHNTHLKSILSTNLKFIEDLNQKIIQLQCQSTNQKYKQTDLQFIQQ